MIRRSCRRQLCGAAAVLALALAPAAPAQAQLIVKDPTNYAQNVLQAARALQQINNQSSRSRTRRNRW